MDEATASAVDKLEARAEMACGCAARMIAESNVPAAVVDESGTFLGLNAVHAALLGSTVEQVTGRRMREVLPARYADPTMRMVHEVLRQGRAVCTVVLWQGNWIRVRFSRQEWDGRPACLIRVDPWRQAIFEAVPPSADQPVEFAAHDPGDLGVLSAREAEVLWMVGQGMSLPALARSINRSIKTVESHVRSVGSKLKLRGRFEIARFAHERGLVHMTHEQVLRVFSDRRWG